MKYFALFGLGGSFGGIQHCHVIEANSPEEAEDYAYEQACEQYESYSNHFRGVESIMEDDGADEEEAQDIWNDERESWLDYRVEPFDGEKVEQYKGYHYEEMI